MVDPAPGEKPAQNAPEQATGGAAYDIQALAYAVAWQETKDCSIGFGAEYNNCFGIKNGNTAPCEKVGRSRMCIYESPEDSYIAFEKIWTTWYNDIPNLEMANRWTGKDRAQVWLNNVIYKYEEYTSG